MSSDDFEEIRELYRKAANIKHYQFYMPESLYFNYREQVIPSSTTHTMHIDHYGKVTYNDLPDKVKAPQVYG